MIPVEIKILIGLVTGLVVGLTGASGGGSRRASIDDDLGLFHAHCRRNQFVC